MEDEYKGPITGKPEECFNNVSSNLKEPTQTDNRPSALNYDLPNYSDQALEKGVQQGVVVNCISINKKIVQFYKSGVVTNKDCQGSYLEKMFSQIATTGYTRIGKAGSKPFWQVRWAYGPNYGVYGSMWIEKWNDSTSSNGPCYLQANNRLWIMKKY